MTTTTTDPLREATDIIDKFLTIASQRDLISADEISDLLLDLRRLITTEEGPT